MTLLKFIVVAALAPALLGVFLQGAVILVAALLLSILVAGAIAGLTAGLTAGLVLRQWLRRLMLSRRF